QSNRKLQPAKGVPRSICAATILRGVCRSWVNESRLFDHLVGAGEQRRGHLEAQCLGSLQVDYQLEPGWLGDRQIARFGAFEYPPCISARIVTSSLEAGSVAGQTTKYSELTKLVGRRNRIA